MEVGDKLWRVIYWPSKGREVEGKKIVKVTAKKVKLAWYDNFWVKKTDIGKEWFPSRLSAITEALSRNENSLEEHEFNLKPLKNEIKALRRMVKRELKKKKG